MILKRKEHDVLGFIYIIKVIMKNTKKITKSEISFIVKCVKKLQDRQSLTRDESYKAFYSILQSTKPEAQFYWGVLFTAIKCKGNSLDETLGLIDAVSEFDISLSNILKQRTIVETDSPIIAITGSGKESFKTFNVSTASAIIASCCGVNIFKPGSRSTSACSGATDVLNELGISIVSDTSIACEAIKHIGLVFMDYGSLASGYAKRYDNTFYHFHPLSYIMPPLYIPIKVDGLVYGIADHDVGFCSQLLNHFGYENYIAVYGKFDEHRCIDEFNPFGENIIAHSESISKNSFSEFEAMYLNDEINISHGDDHSHNSKTLHSILDGTANEDAVNLVASNVALILLAAKKVTTMTEGMEMAKATIKGKKGLNKISAYNTFIEERMKAR